MMRNFVRPAPVLALALALALAGCNRSSHASAHPVKVKASAAATILAVPSAAPSGKAPARLDPAALNERKNPERVLTYFADAVESGQWDAAARAWHKGDMTGDQLKQLFGTDKSPLLAFGKGNVEGAAGSLYEEVPIALVADGGLVNRNGKVILRRVNDVPGAKPWQLAWHIERIDWED